MQGTELARTLATAGLKYLGMVAPSEPLIPPRLATFVNSTAAGGQEWAVSIENDAPDFRERVNHEWYMLGAHQGLFITSKPQFLIAVRDVENDRPDMAWWARVQLQTDWDFAGSGAEAGVTGYSWGRPEFIMLSLNGNVVVQGSQGQKWTDIVCLRDAYHITPLREMGMKLSEDASIPEETRGALSRWLEHTAAR